MLEEADWGRFEKASLLLGFVCMIVMGVVIAAVVCL